MCPLQVCHVATHLHAENHTAKLPVEWTRCVHYRLTWVWGRGRCSRYCWLVIVQHAAGDREQATVHGHTEGIPCAGLARSPACCVGSICSPHVLGACQPLQASPLHAAGKNSQDIRPRSAQASHGWSPRCECKFVWLGHQVFAPIRQGGQMGSRDSRPAGRRHSKRRSGVQ